MRTRFRLMAQVVAAIFVLAFAGPALGASDWQTFRQSGTNAYAFAEACAEDGAVVTCTGESLDAFEGRIRETGQPTRNVEQVCYNEYTLNYDQLTGEILGSIGRAGCSFNAGTLEIDRLTSVSLASTTIDLTEYVCDESSCTEAPGGSTAVHGTWTGIGDITASKGKFRVDDGTCIQVSADKGTSREAVFVGSVDAVGARIGDGSFTFRTTCPLG